MVPKIVEFTLVHALSNIVRSGKLSRKIIYNSHYRNSRSFGLANRSPHLGRNRSRYSRCQTLDQSSGPQDLLYLLYLWKNDNVTDFGTIVGTLWKRLSVLIWTLITGMTTAYGLEQSSSVGLRSLVGFLIRRRKVLRRGQWWRRRNLQSNDTLLSTLIPLWPETLHV